MNITNTLTAAPKAVMHYPIILIQKIPYVELNWALMLNANRHTYHYMRLFSLRFLHRRLLLGGNAV